MVINQVDLRAESRPEAPTPLVPRLDRLEAVAVLEAAPSE
jgi:hypothetical protein